MRYNIDRLEAAGYVERVADPTNGRTKIIRLTERGWVARRVAGKIIASLEGECTRHLGERRMRQFEGLVKEVTRVLEEDQEEGT